MKSFAALLFSIYLVMATLAAPVLHYGKEISAHNPTARTSMEADGMKTQASESDDDMVSRCLRAASFFTTAIPSSPALIATTILLALALLCSMLLRLGNGSSAFDLLGRWRPLALGRAYGSTVRYLALRLVRKWLALLALSPNTLAALNG